MGIGRRMDGCGQFVKYAVFITNFLIFIGGAVVFGISLWALIDTNFVSELLGTNLYAGAIYVQLVTSAIVCILAFLGCIGAARLIKCMLLTYFILLFLIFILMLSGGILGFVFREKVEYTMKQEMRSSLKFYGANSDYSRAWDLTQDRLECCGIDSYWDWKGRLPESCCKKTFNDRTPCTSNPHPDNINRKPCYEEVKYYVRQNAAIIGAAGIIVAFLMIFGMVFSFILFILIK